MKFIDQRANSTVYFNTLDKGEMFICDGQPFLKIDTIETAICNFNAIDLEYGNLFTFAENETIEKVWDCELVIKG